MQNVMVRWTLPNGTPRLPRRDQAVTICGLAAAAVHRTTAPWPPPRQLSGGSTRPMAAPLPSGATGVGWWWRYPPPWPPPPPSRAAVATAATAAAKQSPDTTPGGPSAGRTTARVSAHTMVKGMVAVRAA